MPISCVLRETVQRASSSKPRHQRCSLEHNMNMSQKHRKYSISDSHKESNVTI